ncbi:MAG: sensor histidine kinase, partial [Oscillospiraceae bacterium]|nr:sensor histidine kinase [Oscillospiraceae bacterium]MDY6208100.1 sensor histidine kinase [Oscillospiraceae bacterium]
MKARLISVTALFSALIIIMTGILYFSEKQINSQDSKSEQLVAINEIEQLVKMGEYEKLSEKTALLSESIRSVQSVSDVNGGIFVMCGICLLFAAGVFGYVYFAVLRPFDKLKSFAEKISMGNFD